MKTSYPKASEIPRGWHLVDANGAVLGRLAVRVATILMGKHRPLYSPQLDTGEFVVVVNAAQVRMTGTKRTKRLVRHHTGWIGNLVERPVESVMAKRPEEVITLAIRRMLPKTKLGRQMLKKLKVYAGTEHPHVAQNPRPHALTTW